LARRRDACDSAYCILVVPLLAKSHMTDLVDRILVIDAPEAVQLERLVARDDIDETLARKMIAAQDARNDRLAGRRRPHQHRPAQEHRRPGGRPARRLRPAGPWRSGGVAAHASARLK